MKIRGGAAVIVFGLLALACTQMDESSGSNSVEGERGRLAPQAARPGGTMESPSNDGSAVGSMAAGGPSGDCAMGASVPGDGPLVHVGGMPLTIPALEVGSTLADAYQLRTEFGYLQVTVRSDTDGRVRVFEQGVAGEEVDAWNIQGVMAATETLLLPRGGYAILFEPFGATGAGANISLSAGAYEPVECEPPMEAPDVLGILGSQKAVRAGYVGNLDSRDTFLFRLPEAATLSMLLSDVQGDVALRLFEEGAPDADGDSILLLTASVEASRSIALPRGAYQLRVSPSILAGSNNLYKLSASATEYPVHDLAEDVGQSAAVRDLGTLGASGLTVGGYLGELDRTDAYRIQLAAEAAVVFSFSDATGAPVARLFRDAPAVDDADALVSVFGAATTTDVLAPGSYLVRVTPSLTGDAHSFYTLALGLAR